MILKLPVAMLRELLLPSSILVVNFFAIATQATPIDVAQEANLVRRDNHAALRCSNAPMVVAGAYVIHCRIQNSDQVSGLEVDHS